MDLYQIDAAYCQYLRQYDPLVPYNEGTKQRPFVGIAITIHAIDFYAPLTSPKPKHRRMRNEIDFIKIDHGRLGAVNLNNMIPVHPSLLHPYPLLISQLATQEEVDYCTLLGKQAAWCHTHHRQIQTQARTLMVEIMQKQAPSMIQARCCDFYLDMMLLKQYCYQYMQQDDAFIQDIVAEMHWLNHYRADRFLI